MCSWLCLLSWSCFQRLLACQHARAMVQTLSRGVTLIYDTEEVGWGGNSDAAGGSSDRAGHKSQQRPGLGQPTWDNPEMGSGRVGMQQESFWEQTFHKPGWWVSPRTHLCSHGPRCKHVPAVTEPLWLHLGVTRSVVKGKTVELCSALEDFHVVDNGLVARRDHWLVLQSSVQEGGNIKTVC